MLLFASAAVWLFLGSAFGFIASLKFHSPNFLAGCPFLTYGRVHPAWWNALLYGFCVQAGVGVALWLLAHLGGAILRLGWLATAGAALWNFGLTIGILGILGGQSTGFESLELPGYAVSILFLGYLALGVAGLLNFAIRRERALYVSQWFVFTALFWFAWIYSTATLLLLKFPVRGVAQAVIAWWYAGNLVTVWLGLVGLAIIFYFVPKLTGRDLYSHYLALFVYWMLLLAGSWCGIPRGAPVPAWMPSVSTLAGVLMILPLLAVAVSFYRTLDGKMSLLSGHRALRFLGFAAVAFVLAGLMRVFSDLLELLIASFSSNATSAGLQHLLDFNHLLRFTWYGPATTQFQVYGFFAMAVFGAVYVIAPRLMGVEFRSPKLVLWHFYIAAAGVLLTVVPLGVGGLIEACKLRDQSIAFNEVTKIAINFLRISTLGDAAFLIGSLLFLVNLVGLIKQYLHVRATTAYAQYTADLFKTAGAKP